MARDGKTEKATPKRRQQAKEEGNVGISKEVTTFFNVFSFAVLLSFFGEWFVLSVRDLYLFVFNLIEQELDFIEFYKVIGLEIGRIFLYVILATTVFQLLNHMIQVRFLVAWKKLKPNFKKFNPVSKFKVENIRKKAIDGVRAFLTVTVLGYIGYFVFREEISQIQQAVLLPWQTSVLIMWNIFKKILWIMLGAIFIIALLDYFYQKWEYEESLKMKREDVKKDHKDSDGSPEMKHKQKQVRMAMLKQEIVTNTPDSTVILANPTHFTVAIRYKRGEDPAPKVIAKGADGHAMLIKEIAKEHGIPIVENVPLARALYHRVDTKENPYIPEDLYMAVIMVIKQLISTKKIDPKEWGY